MTFKCKGCERPFKTRCQMETHEKRCPRLRMGPLDSFSKILGKKQHISVSISQVPLNEKVLPLSQPLDPPEYSTPSVVETEDEYDETSGISEEHVAPSSTDAGRLMATGDETIAEAPSLTDAGHLAATGNRATADGADIDFGVTKVSANGHGTKAPGAERKRGRKRIFAATAQPEAISSAHSPSQSNNDDEEDPNCPMCKIDVTDQVDGVMCDMCKIWSHRVCLFMSLEEYELLNRSKTPWFCTTCLSIRANKIKWGDMEGEVAIKDTINKTYNEIIKWRKNLFLLPRGKVGTEFIKELTRLIRLSTTTENKWFRLSLAMVHIFIPMMLQKPSAKSKAKDHAKYLDKRLKLWQTGDIKSIMNENTEIQNKLKQGQEKKKERKEAAFSRLMLLGKVSQAMKFINSEDDTRGVHSLTDEIKQLLQEKHPEASSASADILLPTNATAPEPVIFEEIDGTSVYKAAKHIQGSGGPTLIDADGWRHILCSKSYGNASTELCEAIADLAKKLCREEVPPDILHEFVANRLIPLDKGEDKNGNPGVRPIGIGEILRRIIGKVVVSNIREDIINAAGPLQTCAGLKSGIEASIHAMRRIFDKDGTEALLLVDAENAFNNLNRKAALHNIRELCPPFFRYLVNTYQISAKMIINDQERCENILSEEGSTQGDVTAMGMYAIGTRPLIDILHQNTDSKKCQQVWYADDSSSAGLLAEIRKWWDILNQAGPKFGYYPKASKTILIVKKAEHLEYANEIFANTGINITMTGERHLGAVIGSLEFRESYIEKKIEGWIEDIEQLAEIGKDDPQLAYSACTKAMCMRWSFLQRTIPNTKQYFIPLEETIRDKFIPAVIGRTVTDLERRILSLPVRLGGLGIQNPILTADIEFQNSITVTQNLSALIEAQEQNLDKYDAEKLKKEIARLKMEKEEMYIQHLEEIKTLVSDTLKRALELACEKGAGTWLSALPLQATGYALNKQCFRDGICLRYEWKIPNTPAYCGCGVKNSVTHTLSCKLGGYVHMRHNNIRDFEASLLREICKDVRVEPPLLPVGNVNTGSTIVGDKARLDVSCVGLWSANERSYMDVRVVHPNSASYIDKTPDQIYEQHEREKKRNYNSRVLQVERGSFTPLIFTTTGGMGPEATRYHKRVAVLLAEKRGEEYSHVMNYVRTKIRFSILKSTLIAIRGVRGKQ